MPLLTLGPPGWSSAGGDARRDDVTRFPFSGSDSSPCQDFVCYLTRSLDTSCKVSSDRQSGVAPSSSL